MIMLRQLRAELRKGRTPATVGAFVFIAAVSSLMQALGQNFNPGPSWANWAGAFSISATQHATLLGFVFSGLVAGQVSGAEAAQSSLGVTLSAEPSRRRLFTVKAAALVVYTIVSFVTTAIVLRIGGIIDITAGANFEDTARIRWAVAGENSARAALVIAALATAQTAIALRTASATVPAVGSAAVYMIGFTLIGVYTFEANPSAPFADLTPFMWVTRWMQLDGFGRYVDFVGLPPSSNHNLIPGAVLVAVVLVSGALSERLINRTIATPRGAS